MLSCSFNPMPDLSLYMCHICILCNPLHSYRLLWTYKFLLLNASSVRHQNNHYVLMITDLVSRAYYTRYCTCHEFLYYGMHQNSCVLCTVFNSKLSKPKHFCCQNSNLIVYVPLQENLIITNNFSCEICKFHFCKHPLNIQNPFILALVTTKISYVLLSTKLGINIHQTSTCT